MVTVVNLKNFLKTTGNEVLVHKYPYYNPIFYETEELLKWPFSDRILITAYDILKNDVLIQEFVEQGPL